MNLEAETKEAAFLVFWDRWPRRQAKADARRAWLKIPVCEYPAVVGGLERYRTSDQWKRGIIPHAATWINEKRWEDEDIPQFSPVKAQTGAIHAKPGKYENIPTLEVTNVH